MFSILHNPTFSLVLKTDLTLLAISLLLELPMLYFITKWRWTPLFVACLFINTISLLIGTTSFLILNNQSVFITKIIAATMIPFIQFGIPNVGVALGIICIAIPILVVKPLIKFISMKFFAFATNKEHTFGLKLFLWFSITNVVLMITFYALQNVLEITLNK